ncbi:MAG TPA: hypothetical protein VGJ73_07335 [Verrucomicrobiae bacterium]
MKFLYRSVLTLVAASMPLAATMVKANNIVGTATIDAYNGVYPGSDGYPSGGGEFTAYTSQNYIQYYANVATYQGGFETFCTEVGEEMTPANWGGPTYSYSLGNITQPISGGGIGSATALTQGTAWLYYQFATGNLNNYNYTYGGGREADDTLLQAAIWALQGGQSYTAGGYATLADTEANNIYYLAAVGALNGTANADSAYTGSAIELLQLWDGSTPAQNQLVVTGSWSVPDGGFTLVMLGIGMIGLFFFRSIRAKAA